MRICRGFTGSPGGIQVPWSQGGASHTHTQGATVGSKRRKALDSVACTGAVVVAPTSARGHIITDITVEAPPRREGGGEAAQGACSGRIPPGCAPSQFLFLPAQSFSLGRHSRAPARLPARLRSCPMDYPTASLFNFNSHAFAEARCAAWRRSGRARILPGRPLLIRLRPFPQLRGPLREDPGGLRLSNSFLPPGEGGAERRGRNAAVLTRKTHIPRPSRVFKWRWFIACLLPPLTLPPPQDKGRGYIEEAAAKPGSRGSDAEASHMETFGALGDHAGFGYAGEGGPRDGFQAMETEVKMTSRPERGRPYPTPASARQQFEVGRDASGAGTAWRVDDGAGPRSFSRFVPIFSNCGGVWAAGRRGCA